MVIYKQNLLRDNCESSFERDHFIRYLRFCSFVCVKLGFGTTCVPWLDRVSSICRLAFRVKFLKAYLKVTLPSEDFFSLYGKGEKTQLQDEAGFLHPRFVWMKALCLLPLRCWCREGSEFGVTRVRVYESRERAKRATSACVVVLKQRGVTPCLMTGPNGIFRF